MATQVPPVNVSATALDTRAWSYEPGGRLGSVTDRTAGGVVGRHTDTGYDAVGRPTLERTYQGSGTATLKLATTTSYLGDGQPAAVAFDGSGSSEGSDTLTFTYDAAGRPDQLRRGSTVLSDLAWNPDGTLAGRVDGDGGVLGTTSFAYDWASRLAATTLPAGWQSGGNSATQAYRLDGLLASRTWNGGTAALVTYDAAKRPTGLAKGSLLSLSQAYDRDGNVTSEGRTLAGVTGDAGSGSQSFAYDPLDRVTGSLGLAAGSVTYTYDLDGNRRTKTEAGATYTSTYDRTDQLVNILKTGGTTQAFAYDAYGNLTGNAETGLAVTQSSYDLGDRLTSITPLSGVSATFTLDALGRAKTRVLSVGGTDTYSYAADSETVLRVANSAGTTIDSLPDASGQRLGVKIGAAVSWLTPDLHGNVAAALNQAESTLTDALRYDAYGQTLAVYPSGGTNVSKHWRYQGRLDVAPSGPPLYDVSARFYSPGLGAFTQLDTVTGSAQDPLSLNRFLYAEANPATLVDPDGHKSCFASAELCAETETIKYGPPSTYHPKSSTGAKSGGSSSSGGGGGSTPQVFETPNGPYYVDPQLGYQGYCSPDDSICRAFAFEEQAPDALYAVSGPVLVIGGLIVLVATDFATTGIIASGANTLGLIARGGAPAAACGVTGFCQKVNDLINSINAGLSGEVPRPSSLIPGGSLRANEDLGAHVLREHVGLTEAMLANRLATTNLKAASSFFPSSATPAIEATLNANRGAIRDFLASSGSGIVLPRLTLKAPAGIYLGRGEAQAVLASTIQLFLVRNPASPTGYVILSAYLYP